MASEPRDSFDRIPADGLRRGVHRGPRPKGRGWVTFAWAALATGLLVGLGVVGLYVVNNGIQFTSSGTSAGSSSAVATDAPVPTPTATPTVDPKLTVTILNGAGVEGLATRAGTRATAGGWSVGAEANASASDVATSTVYYAKAENEGAAKGLAATLGGIAVAQSDQFAGADLTAVLGADYAE
ncbi:LytR C-terminal domain-containing protein [Subtercola sp. PAMC28395]|uniref:LytR C-terminal domain-containing protein n=1 Tax=Subtercola sp. PAMC28395 TaxID=2846775 RepID=UPI001C0DA940|nr:LytR C-terminal domain-containing protein [Subtercola sp. PAMC28395]QWT23918.1 LytR C-terminal domain-containing protein [Subtercola sp. PAMC28395]